MSTDRLCGDCEEVVMVTDDLVFEDEMLYQDEEVFKGGSQPTSPCQPCLNINQATRRLFGVFDTVVPQCECLDICVPNVRLICAIPFPTQVINLGSMTGCRGANINTANIASCRIVVTCASENILENCSGIRVQVKSLIVFEDANGNPLFALSLPDFNQTCTSFRRFPTGAVVTGNDLRNEIKLVDGSCVVVNLRCTLSADRRTATVSGNIVEKLWKEENIWVSGILPYPHSITVDREFPAPHRIPEC